VGIPRLPEGPGRRSCDRAGFTRASARRSRGPSHGRHCRVRPVRGAAKPLRTREIAPDATFSRRRRFSERHRPAPGRPASALGCQAPPPRPHAAQRCRVLNAASAGFHGAGDRPAHGGSAATRPLRPAQTPSGAAVGLVKLGLSSGSRPTAPATTTATIGVLCRTPAHASSMDRTQ